MTATIQVEHEVTPVGSVPRARSRDTVSFATAIGILLVIFGLLQNPYWVPGGDSEVYTAIARNLASGKGYMFNGQPVSMVTPGWPLLLALAMKISPTFLFLKLLTMGCMLGALAIAYWILRRFASPALAALVIVLTGILSHVYSLTFWLHSDALFCLVSMAALLVAIQINEGRHERWRTTLLLALCAAAVIVRWAGLFTWLTVAATLLHGELKPRFNGLWKRAVISGALTALTFVALRLMLSVSPEIQRKIREFGGTGEGNEAQIVATADNNLATSYSLFNPAAGGVTGLIGRAGTWGNWFSYLLWQPLRLGRTNALIGAVGLLLGWLVLIPLLIQSRHAIAQRQWIWPALMLYSFALAMNWPRANARYLVPIAPLLILGVFKAFDVIRERYMSPSVNKTSNVLLGYFVATILICNGALWACDAWFARQGKFYNGYEAGLNRDLIYAAHWLNEHPLADGQIGVCEKYVNLGRIGYSRLGLRATTMLTGKAIVAVPRKYTNSGDPRRHQNFLAWARSPEIGVKYVLYQPEVSPWRVFHFRTGWLQETMTGEPAIDSGAGWRLYRIPEQGDEAERVSVPPAPDWPTRVPGL